MNALPPLTDAARPPAPAAEPLAYAGATPFGPLHLVLPPTPPSVGPSSVQAALALAPAEPLLQALEAWLATALDPAPAPDALALLETNPPDLGHARIDDPAWAPPGTLVVLPWDAWRSQALPDPLLTALRWAPVPARIILDHLPGELADRAVEAGDALLLPASFQPDWYAEVRPAENGPLPGIRGPLDDAARLDLDALEIFKPSPPPPGALTVETFDFTGIEGAHWVDGAPLDAAATLDLAPRAAAIFRADGACWVRGELLPVGPGWALRVTSIAAGAQPAADAPL